MWEFILERYNYWIVIILMMTGLYIVISRGNLVKTIIGLNVFQTSVFIFYITIGKIAGGTAPIIIGGHGEGHETDQAHGGDHVGDGHGSDAASHGPEVMEIIEDLKAGSHAGEEAGENGFDGYNDLDAAMSSVDPQPAADFESLHTVPGMEGESSSNSLFADTGATNDISPVMQEDDLHDVPDVTGEEAIADLAGHAADGAGHAAEIIYTNPLPHVLILTAIVVGVATTAVGLALAVRIREAYGTIEEDEIEAQDFEAEFGRPMPGSTAG